MAPPNYLSVCRIPTPPWIYGHQNLLYRSGSKSLSAAFANGVILKRRQHGSSPTLLSRRPRATPGSRRTAGAKPRMKPCCGIRSVPQPDELALPARLARGNQPLATSDHSLAHVRQNHPCALRRSVRNRPDRKICRRPASRDWPVNSAAPASPQKPDARRRWHRHSPLAALGQGLDWPPRRRY